MLPNKFKVIYQDGDETNDINLILVQGLGTCPAKEWAVCSTQWRTIFAATGSRIRLISFEHSITLDNNFTLESIIDEGEALLDGLAQLSSDSDNRKPTAFICHSFGGFILKQALSLANAQVERHGELLSSILGIIFLGVPNVGIDCELTSQKVLLVLKSVSNSISKQNFTRIAEETRLLSDISRLFADIELRVEMLSLYEMKETKVRVGRKRGIGFFNTVHKCVLVDEKHALNPAPRAQCFGLDVDHANLCHLGPTDSEPDSRIQQWIKFVFGSECIDIIERRMKAFRIRSSPATSFTSQSSFNMSNQVALGYLSDVISLTTSTNNATDGSSTAQIGHGWEITPILNRFTTSRPNVQLPCYMMDISVKNNDFFGRKPTLQALDDVLLPSEVTFSSEHRCQKHVVLCGMGGVGKTSIAVEWAMRNRNKFDAVFWIRADEVSKLEQDFGQIAGKLGLEDANEPRDPVVSRELAKGWLANPKKMLNTGDSLVGQAEANWLLIFDNADRPGIIQDYWPISNCGSILMTSRDPRAKTSPVIVSLSIDMLPFQDEEAAVLLQRLSHFNDEKEISIKIAQKLGGLPLAISQMAAIIRYQYLSFSDFLERYEDEVDRKELFSYEAEGWEAQARGNLATIWAVENLELQARSLLELCSVLDPDCIQERILINDACATLELEHYPRRMFTYATARAVLIKSSLIRRNEKIKEITTHRVVQDSICAKMPKNRMADVFTAAVTLVSAAWGTTDLIRRHDMTLSKAREGLFPHSLSLMNAYPKLEKQSKTGSKIKLALLLNEAGWWQHERGNSHDVKHLFNFALDICSGCPEEDTTQLLGDLHYGLSAIANETNDGAACLRHTKVLLEIRTQIFKITGKPDIRLAVAHNEIAIAWVMNGEYDKAFEAYKASIDMYESLEGYWPAMDTNPRTNIGFTYWVIGDLQNASNTLESLLHDREKKFGVMDTESHRTGRVLHALGNIRFDQGRIEESEEFHKKSLAQYQSTIGNNHHKTGDLCHKVAQHYLRRGDLSNAMSLVNHALRIFRLRKHIYAPELARTTFLKAQILVLLGQVEDAQATFEEAKSMRSDIAWATPRGAAELTLADYDELVTFFSR